jgi:hypothetical protein
MRSWRIRFHPRLDLMRQQDIAESMIAAETIQMSRAH